MSTIHCPGGHSFSDTGIPSDHEHHLVADTKVEQLVATIVDAARSGADVDAIGSFQLATVGVTTYLCPICGRLLVFWNGLDGAPQSFMPE